MVILKFIFFQGNLARATYVSSSANIWPWSYNTCNREKQHEQEISACNSVNHFGMRPYQGRGSPEVDIMEAMMGSGHMKNTETSKPYFSSSLQVSPARSAFHPPNGQSPDIPWYHDGLEYGEGTSLNVFFYGSTLETGELQYSTDTLSANKNLNTTDFDAFHLYRLEWESGGDGYLRWYFDNKLIYSITARALNSTGAILPEEPLYIIMNTAMSTSWGFPTPCPNGCSCDCYDCQRPECTCGLGEHFCGMLPAEFLVDYVRVYQDPLNPSHSVGCSPPTLPTTTFIEVWTRYFKKLLLTDVSLFVYLGA